MHSELLLAPPPATLDTAGMQRVRELFTTAGYDEAQLYPLLENPAVPARESAAYWHVVHKVAEPSTLHVLVRLFVLGQSVAARDIEASIAPEACEALLSARLVHQEGEGDLSPKVSILPYDGLLVAFDQPRLAAGAPSDLVMAIAGSSLAVARSAVRLKRRKTLDLGTGNGYLALIASRWSEHVVATDITPRALEFARFNAALNGVTNVEFRLGDRFAPVQGERFNQILCNPPFAITPESKFAYRDGGETLDGFCSDLARTAPAHLEEDGVFQMVCDWAQIEGEEADARLSSWFSNCGCDVLVLKDETRDVLLYAEEWLVETEGLESSGVEHLLEQWLDFYRANRVSTISTGYVLMRRRVPIPPYWFHLEDAPPLKAGEFGDQFWRAVRAQDFLRTVPSDAALLRATVRAAPNLLLRQEAEWHPKGWQVVATKVRFASGLQREATIDQAVMGLVARCDGSRSLGEVVTEMSQALRVPAERLIPGCLLIVRSLIAGGFLLPQISRGAVN